MTTTATPQRPPALPATARAAPAAGDWAFALDHPHPTPALLAGSRRAWVSTPERLWVAFVAVCLGAILLWVACAGSVGGARAGLKSVGQDTAPSILAAGRLRAELADFDCNLVNLLLCAPGSEAARLAGLTVTQRRHEIAENLVRAAENITLGEQERMPLTTLAENLPAYEATLARAQAALARGDRPTAIRGSREAEEGLRLFLQPAAVLLEFNSATALDRAYAQARAGSTGGLALVLGTGGTLTVGLLALQLWLSRRTRRLVNPGLLGATALTVVLSLWTGAALLRASGQLRAGTEDAFASVRYVWQTRALAYGINGEETRWLFDREDPARLAASERAYVDGSVRIAWGSTQPGSPPEVFSGVLATAANKLGLRPPAEPGYLQREMGNVTYPGERDAATAALREFRTYFDLDRRIRELENRGDHAGAVALCLSYAPDGSNGTFARFDDALERLLDINGREFDLAMTRGQGALDGLNILVPAAALGIAGLAFAGIWPRLREYAL